MGLLFSFFLSFFLVPQKFPPVEYSGNHGRCITGLGFKIARIVFGISAVWWALDRDNRVPDSDHAIYQRVL